MGETEFPADHPCALKANFGNSQALVVLRQSGNQFLDHLMRCLLAIPIYRRELWWSMETAPSSLARRHNATLSLGDSDGKSILGLCRSVVGSSCESTKRIAKQLAEGFDKGIGESSQLSVLPLEALHSIAAARGRGMDRI